jgi:nitroreductase
MDPVTAADHLLTTTRSVRRRLDLARPVEPEVIERCLEIAIQAPAPGNLARYHFVVVTDPVKRSAIADLYRREFFGAYLERRKSTRATFPETDERFFASTTYLAEHLHEVPIHVIPCFESRVEDRGAFAQASAYGAILPAAWSFMLALRARGLGAAWTTLHLAREREAAAVLGVPDTVTQAALLPVAYFLGTGFRRAPRVPARERTHWNTWGATPPERDGPGAGSLRTV